MVNVSVIIPVYNEIRFIQKTLESVVGDADEIILSDNASTDGTSDICQSFANRYPEIKYTRHKENMGASKNFLYCVDQSSGKYIRNLGAHDIPSHGSTMAMFKEIEKCSNVSMVYPKYCIYLNSDDTFNSFAFNNFNECILSESPFLRVKELIGNITDFGIFYGVYKTDNLKSCLKICQVLPNIISDYAIIAYMASVGKIIAENKSVIYRYIPRAESGLEHLKHVAKQINGDDKNVYLWNLICTMELYNLACNMQNTDRNTENYAREIIEIILHTHYDLNEILDALNGVMPNLLSDKQCVKDELDNLINDISRAKTKRNSVYNSFFNKGVKIIKYLLPFGLVRYIQKRRNISRNCLESKM